MTAADLPRPMTAASADLPRPTTPRLPGPGEDAVDVMVEVVDGFAEYVLTTERRDARWVHYRANLLWVHSFAALVMAPLFAAIGEVGMRGTSFAVLRTLPGTPLSLAVVLGVGGLVLGLGCVFVSRRVQIAGLLGLLVFYMTLSISFGAASIQFVANGPIPGAMGVPAYYAPIVYLHISIIMAVHMTTLIASRVRSRRGEVG